MIIFISGKGVIVNITEAVMGKTYIINRIEGNPKMVKFLLSLGCYEGRKITLVNMLAGNYVINIMDSRYAVDKCMAESIFIQESV